MSGLSPEVHYRKGRLALREGRAADAAVCFRRAVEADGDLHGLRPPRMRFLAYLYLSIARSGRVDSKLMRRCEETLRRDPLDPELFTILAEIYHRAGRTSKSLATITRGLRVDPSHRGLQRMRARLDRRRRPAVPRLGRDHAINRAVGRIRAAMSARKE